MSRVFRILLVLPLFVACVKEVKNGNEFSGDLPEVLRFEREFYETNESGLPKLKEEFFYMFPNTVHDSIWLQRIEDEREQFLYSESQRVFNDFGPIQVQLAKLFQQIKNDRKDFEMPKVVTHVSNLDFQYPVIFADSLVFISLDMYLGKDHEAYGDFPKYLSYNFTRSNLIVDVSNEINNRFYKKLRSRSFRDKIINEAKFVFANASNLPEIQEHIIIGYSKDKFDWAVQNESDVWKYFVEHELLYSTESTLNSRFIDVAPFSKFYLESDNDSPGRIGVWIGWQIIKSYMKNNDVTLQKLMETSPEIIYNKSKYKPRKN